MLSIIGFMKRKRFGLGLIKPEVVVEKSSMEVTVEKAAQVPANFHQVGDMEIEDASKEWAVAVSALAQAQINFDSADAEYIDTAVTALNLAYMRVDNAQRRIRQLMGPMGEDKAVGA